MVKKQRQNKGEREGGKRKGIKKTEGGGNKKTETQKRVNKRKKN
jgi:hypothetical protein